MPPGTAEILYNAYGTKPNALKAKAFKAKWLCSSARFLDNYTQKTCTFHWCVLAHQWKYALQQWLNSIKAALVRRFYGIARLPPRE